jgi:hypothetical protein
MVKYSTAYLSILLSPPHQNSARVTESKVDLEVKTTRKLIKFNVVNSQLSAVVYPLL